MSFSVDGFSEDAFSVSEHVEADSSAFAAFLDRVAALREWLLEIDALPLAPADSLSGAFGESVFSESGFSDDESGNLTGVRTLRYSAHGWTRRDYGYADHLSLPGTSGNYASTPDSAALRLSQNWVPWSEDVTQWGNAGFNLAAPVSNVYADPTGAVTVGTLEDNDAARYEGRRAVQAAIPNDGATYQIAFIVRKDFAATHRAGVNFRCQSGGTQVIRVMRFALDGTNASACTVTSYDADYWLVTGTVTNNSSGNVLLTADFFPAVSTTKGGSDNPSGVGTTAFGWVRVQRSNTLLPYVKTAGVANKGRIDIRLAMTANDSTELVMIAKDQLPTRGWFFRKSGSGNLKFAWSSNGSSVAVESNSSVGGLYVVGQKSYVRVTLDTDDGSGSRVTRFYKSLDAGVTWNLEQTITVPSVVPIFDTESLLTIGMRGGGAYFSGKIHYAELRNGIDGPVVARFDPSVDARPGDTSFVSSTGETWTINQSGGDPARLVAGGEVGLHYDGRIAGFTVERDIAGRDGVGGIARVFAELRLVNGDGGLDMLREDYALDGRAVRILVGDRGGAYADFGTVFSGVVESATVTERELQLRFSDGMARLELPIQGNRYLGTGGLEGGADLKGKPKPLCYGRAYNVAPVMVDAFNLIYQVHDGAIQDVPALRDRAVALTKVVGAPAPGEYSVDTATGTLQLGAMPDGELTCDVEGDAPAAGYSERLAVIAQRILAAKLYTSEIDTTAFANLNALIEAPVGFFVGAEERTAADVLGALLGGAGCFAGFSRQGVFTGGRLSEPNADAPVLALDETDIVSVAREPLPEGLEPIAWSVSVGWRLNHTVQSDIAALASDADRAFAVEQWRVARAENSAVQSRHLLAREYGPVESPFVEAADAESEADRLFALWGTPRGRYRVTTMAQGMLADVGRAVLLTHPRHGLRFGRAARVIGQTVSMSRTELRVIV